MTFFTHVICLKVGILHVSQEIFNEMFCWAGGKTRARRAGCGFSGRRPAAGRLALSARSLAVWHVICGSRPSLSRVCPRYYFCSVNLNIVVLYCVGYWSMDFSGNGLQWFLLWICKICNFILMSNAISELSGIDKKVFTGSWVITISFKCFKTNWTWHEQR